MKTLLLIIVSLTFVNCSHTPQPVPVSEVSIEEVREPASFQSCLEVMSSIMGYEPYHGPAKQIFSKAKNLSELESFYGGESLIEIQRRIPNEEIKLNNANLKKLFKEPFSVKPIKGKKSAVTLEEADTIYRAMADSNVNKNHYCYDTKGTIGFCFGRATIAHMEAIVREVHPDAIKKIWIAGDMEKWGHHVATMIHTEQGWMVLDTNLGRVVDVDDWIATYLPMKAAKAKEIMVFETQAGRFGPYDNRPYNAIDLFNTKSEDFNKAKDYFNGYFHDYFESLDNLKNKPLMH